MCEVDSTTILEEESLIDQSCALDSEHNTESVSSTVCNEELLDLPEFLEDDPKIWFTKLESIFSINCITSEDYKFNIVVASLEAKILKKAREAVTNPPVSGKYENLKKMLLEKYDQDTIKSEDLFSRKAKIVADKILKLITDEAELQSDLVEFGEEFQKLWKRNSKRYKFNKNRRSTKKLKSFVRHRSFNRVKPCSIKRK